jgi:hypothetical protein
MVTHERGTDSCGLFVYIPLVELNNHDGLSGYVAVNLDAVTPKVSAPPPRRTRLKTGEQRLTSSGRTRSRIRWGPWPTVLGPPVSLEIPQWAPWCRRRCRRSRRSWTCSGPCPESRGRLRSRSASSSADCHRWRSLLSSSIP